MSNNLIIVAYNTLNLQLDSYESQKDLLEASFSRLTIVFIKL